MSELMQAQTKMVESDLDGFGYSRIEWCEKHGDSSTLEITYRDNTNDPMQTMRIVGSIEIAEFFKLINRARRA